MRTLELTGRPFGAFLVLMAAAVLPRAALADSGSAEKGSVAFGPTVGFTTGNSITQFRLTGEGQYTITSIAPRLYFELAGHIGVAIGTFSQPYGLPSPTATSFEIVPAARLRYAIDEKLSLYGDVDVGIEYIAFSSTSYQTPAGTFTVGGGSQTWGLFRFGLGVQYKVTPTIILFGDAAGLNVYVGNGAGFMYSLGLGALFKV